MEKNGRFIELTLTNGGKVTVNTNHILHFEPGSDHGGTFIFINEETYLDVTTSYEDFKNIVGVISAKEIK